jgi:hypothetical protein
MNPPLLEEMWDVWRALSTGSPMTVGVRLHVQGHVQVNVYLYSPLHAERYADNDGQEPRRFAETAGDANAPSRLPGSYPAHWRRPASAGIAVIDWRHDGQSWSSATRSSLPWPATQRDDLHLMASARRRLEASRGLWKGSSSRERVGLAGRVSGRGASVTLVGQ